MTPINTLHLAVRLNEARNGQDDFLAREIEKNPRIPEMLLFLEYQFRQPGGAERFVKNLVDHQLATIGMRGLTGLGATITRRHRFNLWKEIPDHLRRQFPEAWLLQCLLEEMESLRGGRHAQWPPASFNEENGAFAEDTKRWLSKTARASAATEEELFNQVMQADPSTAEVVDSLTPDCFRSLCADQARSDLATHLAGYCNGSVHCWTACPWYWADLPEALFAEMDLWCETVSASIAKTTVYNVITDALDFIYECPGKMSRLDGETRFGKSIAALTYCQARPGRARYLTVPPLNSVEGLIKEIAKAFGIDTSRKSAAEIQDAVETVCQAFKAVVVLDEGHGLFPASASRHAPAKRLDWVRLGLLKKDVPVAIVTTPQWKTYELEFRKNNRYNLDQLTGLIISYPQLPASISLEELVSIGRIQLPGLSEDKIELIACRAMQLKQYAMLFEGVAKNALWLARRAGRSEINDADIERAIVLVTPPEQRAPAPAPASIQPARQSPEPDSNPAQRRARKPKPGMETTFPRGITPALDETNHPAPALSVSPRETTPTIA